MRRGDVLIAHAHKCFLLVPSVFIGICVCLRQGFLCSRLCCTCSSREYGVGRVGRRQTLGTNDRGFYGESDSLHTRCRRFLTTELCQRTITPLRESKNTAFTRPINSSWCPLMERFSSFFGSEWTELSTREWKYCVCGVRPMQCFGYKFSTPRKCRIFCECAARARGRFLAISQNGAECGAQFI